MSSTPEQMKRPPCWTAKPPYWKLSGDGSGGKCSWKRPTGHRRGPFANTQKNV